MQVSLETTSGLERRLTVGIPAKRIEDEINVRLQKAAKTIRINGFRTGKVPMRVVKQRIGSSIRQEVLGEIVNETFMEAIQQQSVNPAGRPNIEPSKMEEGEDFEYVATFEVFPEIALADFSVIKVEKYAAEITEADVDKMIDILRKQNQGWAIVERAAANEDKVNIDYLGTKEGVAFQGGTAEGSDLVLGSGRMIPGFEDGIVGMNAGAEKVLNISFPENYHAEELKGAAVEFKIKVNSVSEPKLPELNEEFYKMFGVDAADAQQFRDDVKTNMQREVKSSIKNKIKTQIMDALLELQQLDVPKALIDMEIDQLRRQAITQFGGGAKLDPNLLPAEMFSAQAKRRVSLGLVLNEVIKQNQLEADKEKVREMVEDMASTYQDPEEVINYYYGNEQQLASIQSAVLEDAVVDFILSQANVTISNVSYEEAIKPAAQNRESSDETENTDE